MVYIVKPRCRYCRWLCMSLMIFIIIYQERHSKMKVTLPLTTHHICKSWIPAADTVCPDTAGGHRWFIDWTGTHGHGGKCHWDEQWPLGSTWTCCCSCVWSSMACVRLVHPCLSCSYCFLDLIFDPQISHLKFTLTGVPVALLISPTLDLLEVAFAAQCVEIWSPVLRRSWKGFVGLRCRYQCWNLVVLLYYCCSYVHN